MAKSGSIVITQGTQEIANNRTYITVTGKITTSGESWRGDSRTGTYTIKQGSTVLKSGNFTHGAPSNSTTTLFSISLWVDHDSNGNSGVITATFNYDSGWCTGTSSKTLTTIPRKSELSVANGTLGTPQTLKVTRKSTSFTHSIKVECGSVTRYIKADGTLSTSEVKHNDVDISFTPPLEWANQNTTGTSVSVKYTIITYNGTTNIGNNQYTKTCSIPESVAPTVSFTVEDGVGYMDWYGGFIQGKSTFRITINASGNQGSTIKAYKTTADGKTYTSDSIVSSVISGSGEMLITVVVTDSRGRTATVSKTVTVIPYTAPKITSFKAERSDASGNPTSTGTHLKITFSSLISSVNSKNGCSYVLQIKKISDEKYEEVELSSYAGNLSVTNGTYVFPADTGSSYNLILRAADNFVVTPSSTTGASVKKLWSWLKNNLGIAFGKVAELPDVLDIGFKTKFTGGILQSVLEDATNFDDLMIPNTYTLKNASSARYLNSPITDGTGTLTIETCGEEGQIHQIVKVCNKTNPLTFERFYYQESWGEWRLIHSDSGWISITPTNGTAGTGMYIPQYRKVGNQVFLRGYIGDVSADNTTLFTLPEGFRPTNRIRHLAVGDYVDTYHSIRILETGIVSIFRVGNSTVANLDCISFLVD